MMRAIIYLCISAIIISSFSSCSKQSLQDASIQAVNTENTANAEETIYKNQETTPKNYIDNVIFLGESTTFHLKSRGVLSEGKQTKQVWAPKSGTLMLDPTICDCRIIYPETNEEISLEEALKIKQPEIMLLTFGLNGATNFISRGENYFKFCYKKLLNLIKDVSPNTNIIINSCFPVAKNMDMSRYTIDAKKLNEYINTLNLWAKELANEIGLRFTDSSQVLTDNEGYLSSSLQAEDGYHLNSEAYKLILKYLNNELQILTNQEN